LSSSHAQLDGAVLDRLAKIKLFAMDVDGTLTDGRVTYIGPQESQSFDVQDGQGLVWMRKAGIKLAWITGRGCAATERRAEELGVEFQVMQCKDKLAALREIQTSLQIRPQETLSMGDDLPDLALASASGFFCAPANARPEVIERADYVTRLEAGRGAARELCELYLRASGHWDGIHGPTGR
jgi:3-deoxy-D-manno-octulosonate 8-phosphate phosphatase (KDO 8-P phosphatase)